MLNLVGNAIKFTEAGEVVVDVRERRAHGRARPCCASPCRTRASASRPRSSAQIFEAFVQADASTTRQFGGTGLGLTISAQLVELMGGRIWLESETGQGSRFRSSLRFARAPLPAPEAPPPDALRGVRVLSSDDNADEAEPSLEGCSANGTPARPAASARNRAGDAARAALAAGRPWAVAARRRADAGGRRLRSGAHDSARRGARRDEGDHADVGRPAAAAPAAPGDLAIAAQLSKPLKQSDLRDALVGVAATLPGGHPAGRGRGRRGFAAGSTSSSWRTTPRTRRSCAHVLKRRGYRVTTVSTGREAVQQASSARSSRS